ncbi:MAG TPA: serine/threonine-protein kinase [Ktedonobacteraceae bacterium]|nr:serine/threonine-protein kinase [Ktedonobacteraceae bacterium]
MPDRTGQQLGHYRLTRLIGHGGFADVYLAEHVYLGTPAAMKLLDTRLSQAEIERFQQEARTIARLEHPHIIRVLDFGVQDHLPFLVMHYAAHGSLRQRYARGTRLSLTTITSYVKQIASALQYAHDAKFVHRDIKPENMLLGRNDEVLLSDFGLAVVAESSSRSGHTRDVSGTVVYMAPEQAKGKPQPASDQYALGVVVYEWLCGQRPFDGTYEEVAIQHAIAPPPPLRERMDAISPALEAVVLRALAKDPHERFASVQDFAQMLEQASLVEQGWTEPLQPTQFSPSLPGPSTLPTPPGPISTEERATTEIIYTVAWSPDRRRIAYGGNDRTIQVRGATTGASTLLYRGHSGSVTTIVWSPDGQSITSASLDRTIQVWNATTGLRLSTHSDHIGMVSALAWSPDGKFLASTCSGTDTSIHIWDATNGENSFMFRGHAYWVRALAWSPNGKYIASGSWREVQVWESTTGRKLFSHRGHHSWVRTVAWSPDGSQIASAGEDNMVQLWEPTNKGRQVTLQREQSDWINLVIWSPDGAWLASASKDNVVTVWNAETATKVSTYHVRATSAYAITWLLDNKHIVSASGSGSVQVWQVNGGAQ